MSKWGKGHGLIVPIDSLLKEKENTNRPAPLRSAGLVGRWGITSFTSIRNTSYEFESTSPKESDDLNCSSNVASLSTQVPNPIKPKKFFKSRNTFPPVAATPDPHRDSSSSYGSPQHRPVLFHQAAQLKARIAQDAGGSPPYTPTAGYYQQLGAAASTETKPKKKSKKKKQKHPDADAGEEQQPTAPEEESSSAAKKEKPEPKKEKKQKKAKKEAELPPELPKRNSSRIRNKVVNYNEDDDSFDMIPYRDEVSRTPPVSKLALEPAPVPAEEPLPEPAEEPAADEDREEEDDAEEEEEEDEEEQEVTPEEPIQAPAPSESVSKGSGAEIAAVPLPGGLGSPSKSGSGGSGAEDRVRTREHKELKTVPVPLSSPSVVEHPPIVLRISKELYTKITN